MRSVVLSFDDGTIYDKRFIELLDKYGLKATFNLNSGLGEYVWYLDSFPVERLNLLENKEIYKNHEVASHTVTHPYLTSLTKEQLIHEINDDVNALESIFNIEVSSFAVPMDQCNEEIIKWIKEYTKIKYLRIPSFTDSYVPRDRYHICPNAWYYDEKIYEKIEDFSNNLNDHSVFIIVGHSYEFEVNNDWDKIERLIAYLANNDKIVVNTFSNAMKDLFKFDEED